MKKILIADFSKGNEKAYVRGLYQHDYGAILKVTGIEYAEIIRVDFAGTNDEKAHPVVALQEPDGGFCVKIPKENTDKAGELSAYIYVTDAEAGFTIKEVILPIIERVEADPDPSGEKTDPFAEVIEEIKKSAKSASNSAASAAESKKSASESATQAEKAKEAAELSAEAAAESKEAAGVSASNAAQSASQSRESATAAQTAADQATKSATAAAESETAVTQLAENATQSAQNASSSAESASQSAETAKTAAGAAEKSASAAQQAVRSAAESASTATAAAQTATTAAGKAAESETTANQSAEIAGQKATAAETSASNAAESATAAEKSATAAGDSASAAKTSETAAEEAAQTAQEQAGKIKDSAEQIEKNKADADSLKEDFVAAMDAANSAMDIANKSYVTPELRNGSMGNSGNQNAIGMKYALPINGAKSVTVIPTFALTKGYYFHWNMWALNKSGEYTTNDRLKEYDPFIRTRNETVTFDFSAFPERSLGFAFCLFERNEASEYVVHRIEKDGKHAFKVIYNYENYALDAEHKELAQEVENLKEDLTSKADKTSLAQTDRKLDALWKLNQGVSYQFEQDSTEAYQKTVPTGAKLASIKKIGGKTIVWNQLFNSNTIKTATYKGVTFTNNGDGTYTANGTATEESFISIAIKFTKGHMYYMRSLTTIASSRTYKAYVTGSNLFTKMTDIGYGAIDTAISGSTGYFVPLYISKGVTVENLKIAPKIVGLTQMFGSGNEPSTVEEFEAMFPDESYPYNAGELMRASVNEVIYLDTKNQETSYQIPQAIRNLPGYGWSAGDVRNEVDWENKQYIQRVGAVDLGTLNWKESGDTQRDGNSTYKSDSLNTVIRRYSTYSANSICEKFNIVKTKDISRNEYEYSISNNGTAYPLQFTVKSTFCTDENDFKNKINGIMLYYELAEPIITDISDIIGDAFQEPFEVESGGTLTFQNSHDGGFQIPVPSEEEYIVSLTEVGGVTE